ncbi:hypothetical protein Q3G72_007680 [Acer saccharum]|nr:hypothetical protein Q3G72_007680 [Acer saccharum]
MRVCFTAENGKLYYGVATFKGLYVFNKDKYDNDEDHDHNTQKDQVHAHHDDHGEEKGDQKKKELSSESDDRDVHEDEKVLAKYKIRLIDFVHAFSSLMVFLVFALSITDVP